MSRVEVVNISNLQDGLRSSGEVHVHKAGQTTEVIDLDQNFDAGIHSIEENDTMPHESETKFELEDVLIDQPRKLHVAVIGAGIAGITAGILLPAKVPNIELTIFEKNHDVSGTWLENNYPGVRCDIASHVYQSTFDANSNWSQKFAPGNEIRDYWQRLAKKYDVYRYVKLNTKVKSVRWSPTDAKWRLLAETTSTTREETLDFDFVIPAIGRFNAWKLPVYPGIDDYKGHLRHTSNWDPSFNPEGKTIAVIGNGASGIQVVPNLQRIAKRIDHYARNKTWIAEAWAGEIRTFEAQLYDQNQIESFKDPETYLQFRKALENKYWRRFHAVIRDSPENEGLRERFIEIMAERLSKKPELLERMIPDFSPNCRRLTPGPGYLEALTEENVDYIQTPIKRFTPTGIETVDGVHREVDAVLCATGANVDFVPPFTIEAHGIDLKDAWRFGGKIGWPRTYLGLAASGFPNLLLLAGPHGTGPAGTVPHDTETQITYFAKLLRKVSSQGIKTIVPSEKAVEDFVAYSDAFFAKTVLTDNCSSWANGGRPGARIHGLWPGSAAHLTHVRREPRWEDWDYEYLSPSNNRFAYFGPGWTGRETLLDADMTSYLKVPSKTDLRDIHESWWETP